MKSLTPEEIISKSIEVKGRPGIYFLIDKGEIVYVGKTTNCSTRLATHSGEKRFTRVYFLAVDRWQDLDELERFYIDKFKPALNKTRVWAEVLPGLSAEGSPLERAMMRVRMGQPGYSSAKAEGISTGKLYTSKAYRDFKNEAN